MSIDTSGEAEDWNTVSIGLKSDIDKLAQETYENSGGKVLVVSHGITLMTLLTKFPQKQLYRSRVGLRIQAFLNLFTITEHIL